MTKEQIKERLQAAKIENAAGEARLLWESFSGEALESAVQRRCTHYPLQYILGEWCFWRESYEVSEHCLVPRPDTEHLVEQAISRLPQDACFLDLCTGSGCVAISVLCSRPDTHAVAVDLFPETLALAERNAVKNGVRERLTPWLCDVLTGSDCTEEFDAILSNPRISARRQWKRLRRRCATSLRPPCLAARTVWIFTEPFWKSGGSI